MDSPIGDEGDHSRQCTVRACSWWRVRIVKSFSDERRGRIPLVAVLPRTEVLVRDNRFPVVGRSVGYLDIAVAPGLYQIERRLGDTQDSQIVAIQGEDYVDHAVNLPLSAVAPVAAATGVADEYRAATHLASTRTATTAGHQ